jgi:hypothetical protein
MDIVALRARAVIEGLPIILRVLIVEAFAIMTVVNPESRWAFNFNVSK